MLSQLVCLCSNGGCWEGEGAVPVTNLKGLVTIPPSSSGSGVSISTMMAAERSLIKMIVFVSLDGEV